MTAIRNATLFLLADVLAMALALTPATAGARSALAVGACPSAGRESAKVAKIDERLDLTLEDGRSLHLAGLDPVQPTRDSPDLPLRAQAALAKFLGAGVDFIPLAAEPDRWGRLPAFVFLPAKPGEVAKPLANLMLAQGLARYMPVPEARPCGAEFLAAEAIARDAKIGLWRDPYYAIIEATDRSAFADKAASNVIVEGRLVSVDSTRFRITLDFTAHATRGFSVTVLQRNVAIFERSGLPFRALIGRSFRVRGLLDLRFGPQIEISSPDEIELLSDGHSQAGVTGQNVNAEIGAAKEP
jgi:endonuclease YncB( thermonuclease family)